MPFGVSWGQYVKMWGVCVVGFACGSQLIHSFFKPLDNVDKLVEIEVNRLREELKLKKPTFDDKLNKLLQQDEEYKKLFNWKPPIEKNSSLD